MWKNKIYKFFTIITFFSIPFILIGCIQFQTHTDVKNGEEEDIAEVETGEETVTE
jgi:hypothetical protein